MELVEFQRQLEELASAAEVAFQAASTDEAFEAARVAFTGARSGQVKSLQKELGGLPKEHKPAGGKALNDAKQRIQSAMDAATERLKTAVAASASSGPVLDPTLPGTRRHLGTVHPITQTIEHLKSIMSRLGFSVVEGPEVEDTWHNFVALNIPEDHPARDPLDNFYLSLGGKTAIGSSAGHARCCAVRPAPFRFASWRRRPHPYGLFH